MDALGFYDVLICLEHTTLAFECRCNSAESVRIHVQSFNCVQGIVDNCMSVFKAERQVVLDMPFR